mmetsp:Transcript_18983/g.35242  ORF Transcript_18983/g.35242 Transcript_18983/m.35242 type:complete len:263 (-) Transcript_18983:416-1204(-)
MRLSALTTIFLERRGSFSSQIFSTSLVVIPGSNSSTGKSNPSTSEAETFLNPMVETTRDSMSPLMFSSRDLMYVIAETTSPGWQLFTYATSMTSSWRISCRSLAEALMASPRTRPPGTNISVVGSNFLESKWRSWVRRAREASCWDCVRERARHMVCTMSWWGRRGVRECEPSSPSTSALERRWFLKRWVSSSSLLGRETLEGARLANSNIIVLSALMQTLPLWLMSSHLKVMTECSPSLVFLMFLTWNFLVKVSPAKPGQW